jgi:DNA gyrase/topoisomerase IV subunit A
LIDDSNTEKEIVNQLPYEHVKTQILTHIYSLNKKNNNGLFLVIEFIKNLEEENNVKPINYYFEYTQPLVKSKIGNTDIPLEDINVFLSLLN